MPKEQLDELETLGLLIDAWKSRDWIEEHVKELFSTTPCQDCLSLARAVLRGQGDVRGLVCAEGRGHRSLIQRAAEAVKNATGDVIC